MHNKSKSCGASGAFTRGPDGEEEEVPPARKFSVALPVSSDPNYVLGSPKHGQKFLKLTSVLLLHTRARFVINFLLFFFLSQSDPLHLLIVGVKGYCCN